MAKKPQKKSLEKSGLFVAAAIFCEKIIREADNVATLVRVVDKVVVKGTVELDTPNIPQPVIQLAAFISFRSRSKRKAAFELRLRRPSGRPSEKQMRQHIDLNGDWAGGSVSCNVAASIREAGVHWFDVYLDGHRMATMPLAVEYEKVSPKELFRKQGRIRK